jgi:hypothetical protein
MGYTHPDAVVTAPSGVKIDPYDPAFSARTDDPQDPSLPAVYLFSNTRSGDGPAYSMAEDGTVLGEHWCSHRGYMRHDLHDRRGDGRVAVARRARDHLPARPRRDVVFGAAGGAADSHDWSRG